MVRLDEIKLGVNEWKNRGGLSFKLTLAFRKPEWQEGGDRASVNEEGAKKMF